MIEVLPARTIVDTYDTYIKIKIKSDDVPAISFLDSLPIPTWHIGR